MRVCPKCGYRDYPYWRGSRYDFNADYCRREEFAEIEPELDMVLGEEEPLIDEELIYYRRGTGKIWVYRVSVEDFKVSTDKRRAYTKSHIIINQRRLLEEPAK